MSDQGPEGRRRAAWRDRYDAERDRGIPLDPRSEPVAGVEAYPTDYAPDHLLIMDGARVEELLKILAVAAGDFGWGVRLQTMDGQPTEPEPAIARARRARDELELPTFYRVAIVPDPQPGRDDQPVPPIDAWRLLQRARARTANRGFAELRGVSLDHVLTTDSMSLNPFGRKTNPFGRKTNPFGRKTNPAGSVNMTGTDSYGIPGSGGRQVVNYIGAEPARTLTLDEGGRRPVVAVLDTGCGPHPWLPPEIVARAPKVEDRFIGIVDDSTDPEVIGDVSGPFDGDIDDSAGHGTFIAGVVRQVCPEADIVAIRVADSQGTVLEGDFMLAVRSLVKWMSLPVADGGHQIDVLNLSLGYYHETPEDDLADQTLSELLVAARRRGCAVVCSAGNDATDRPSFPAALWAWDEAELIVEDPTDAAPHLSVGALNPNGTMALFSNLGGWVRTFAPGAAVLSTLPPFNGGTQPGTRDDRGGVRRETIDPDDFIGGFGLWSGTSFAAPYVAGMLARSLAPGLMDGSGTSTADRVTALRAAETAACDELALVGPIPA